ncbi:tumor necrosis factor ligand superfamily member 15-like [Sebastes fasciatus]|uniref:tumor necrosis factor ligand superfamily member 15-like n=1 Tax=Sebastes fasciatus TaxID=394691 RepID=UPI003D9E2088
MDMGHDESTLILIKHCRDMKKQETRLRFITLLLVFSCTTLFMFTIWADLRHRENSGSSGQPTAVAFSKQETVCPADNPQKNIQRLQLNLLSESGDDNTTHGQYLKWYALPHEKYNKQKRAIVIPEDGSYFIYVRISLGCHDFDQAKIFSRFFVALHQWNEGYPETQTPLEVWDGINCTSDTFRSVFVGQLFDLSKGDHMSVWIGEGYKLITKSAFGAFLT